MHAMISHSPYSLTAPGYKPHVYDLTHPVPFHSLEPTRLLMSLDGHQIITSVVIIASASDGPRASS